MVTRSKMDMLKNPPKNGKIESWQLFFKLFCFLKPQNVPNDSLEAAFIFEQVSSGQSS